MSISWTFVGWLWAVVLLALLGQWLIMRRTLRKWRLSDPVHPDIVLAGRRLYEDGEFRREIIERMPDSLFDDKVRLACGHETTTMRTHEETHTNCYQCAQQWMQQESNGRKK